MSGSNRLGFALLLKFFQIEARFPISKQEIPKSVVSYIAKQVDVSPRAIKEYSFSGRTIERHRSQIRQFFGFRETTVEDAFELTKWLQEKVLAYDRQESHLQAAAYQRLRELKVEPPSPDRMERLIRSAVHTCEETFCSTIFEQLL